MLNLNAFLVLIQNSFCNIQLTWDMLLSQQHSWTFVSVGMLMLCHWMNGYWCFKVSHYLCLQNQTVQDHSLWIVWPQGEGIIIFCIIWSHSFNDTLTFQQTWIFSIEVFYVFLKILLGWDISKYNPDIRRIFLLLTNVYILPLFQMTMGYWRVTTLKLHVTGLIH